MSLPVPATDSLLHGLPPDASVDGHTIDWMIHFALASITVLFAAMMIWLLWSCFFHGRRHTAAYIQGNTRKAAWGVIGFCLAIFFFVDGTLFVKTMSELSERFWNYSMVEADPNTIRIEINGERWAWSARYAGPDGKFGTPDDVVTLNDVRIPVGQPVYLQLASSDVIHSFYMPNMRVKQDVIPGQVNRLWFEAKETGQFEIGCAQHCGPNHYKMRGILTVLPPAEFHQWLKAQGTESAGIYDPHARYASWGWPWEKEEI